MNKYTLVILFALIGIVFAVGCASSVPQPTTDQNSRAIPSTISTPVATVDTTTQTPHPRPHSNSLVTWGEAGSPHDNITNVTALSAGIYDSLILKDDGTVVCLTYSGNFTHIANLTNVTAIAGSHLVLKDDGTVVSLIPRLAAPANLTNVKAIATSEWHSLALKDDGTVVAWGDNEYSQCNVPANLTNVTAVAAGVVHYLALKADGTVVAWGDNESGQCNVPANLTNVTAVAAGSEHSLAILENESVIQWGYSSPTRDLAPDGFTNVTAIATGWGHTIGLKADGTLVGWGEIVRQIGLTTKNGPPPIPPIPDWMVGCKVRAIAAGQHHCIAFVDTCETSAASCPTNNSTCTNDVAVG